MSRDLFTAIRRFLSRDRRRALRRLRELAKQDEARAEALQRTYAGHRRASRERDVSRSGH